MPIRGDRLRWPPRPGKRSGASLSTARRPVSHSEVPNNTEQQPLSVIDGGRSGAVASSSRESACPTHGVDGADEKLIRNE